MNVVIEYGCPKCPPVKVNTGWYDEWEVWVNDPESPWCRLIRYFTRKPPPRHKEQKSCAITRPVYPPRHLELNFPDDIGKLSPFTCPLCGTEFKWVELRLLPQPCTIWMHYTPSSPEDGYHSIFDIEYCQDCSRQFSRYQMDPGGNNFSSQCRSCGAAAWDLEISGQRGSHGPNPESVYINSASRTVSSATP